MSRSHKKRPRRGKEREQKRNRTGGPCYSESQGNSKCISEYTINRFFFFFLFSLYVLLSLQQKADVMEISWDTSKEGNLSPEKTGFQKPVSAAWPPACYDAANVVDSQYRNLHRQEAPGQLDGESHKYLRQEMIPATIRSRSLLRTSQSIAL